MSNTLYEKNIEDLKKLTISHPNLSNFWIEYMEKKKQSYLKANKSCQHFLNNIDKYPDFDNKTILILMLINNGLLNNDY